MVSCGSGPEFPATRIGKVRMTDDVFAARGEMPISLKTAAAVVSRDVTKG